MSDVKEFQLTVPAELVRHFQGLCIDFGSSLIKLVYRSKEDQDESSTTAKDGQSHLHLVSFPRPELNAALEYVKQRAVMTATTSDQKDPVIYTTGFGCTQYGHLIENTLNVKLQQLTEFDCFVKSFTYLAARLPRSEFLEPFIEEATVQPVEAMKVQLMSLQKFQDENLSEGVPAIDTAVFMKGIDMATGKPSEAALQAAGLPLAEAEPDMYPCLLAMCGSGCGFFKIEKDGSFKVVDYTNRTGRCFAGVGSLLTDGKTFEELIDLASKGDNRKVDQYSNDMFVNSDATKSDGDDAKNMYSMSAEIYESGGVEAQLVFCFGKAVGLKLEDFKREDVARAWLNELILDLVQTVQLVGQCNGIKHVFLSGGLFASAFVRHVFTAEYARRSLSLLTFGSPLQPIPYDFVKPGAHLGALGCVVHHVNQSTAADK